MRTAGGVSDHYNPAFSQPHTNHMQIKTFATTLAMSTMALAAMAQEATQPANDTPVAATAAASAPADQAPKPPAQPEATAAPTAVAASKEVPKLTIRWDCGDCELNAKVAPLIEDTYQAGARDKGYSVSATETAEIRITEYRQRPPAVRALFGVMAGVDKLYTKFSFRGKEYAAGDYSANVMQGMNYLCETVAKQTLKLMLDAVK